MGAEGFHGRVRNGIGCWDPRQDHQVVQQDFCTLRAVRSVFCVSDRRIRDAGSLFERELALRAEESRDQADRAIRTSQLNALLRFHTWPINVVVFHGSSGRTRLEVGFPLRCFQRLSRPDIATLHCGWRHNRSTRDPSIPVLSY